MKVFSTIKVHIKQIVLFAISITIAVSITINIFPETTVIVNQTFITIMEQVKEFTGKTEVEERKPQAPGVIMIF